MLEHVKAYSTCKLCYMFFEICKLKMSIKGFTDSQFWSHIKTETLLSEGDFANFTIGYVLHKALIY